MKYTLVVDTREPQNIRDLANDLCLASGWIDCVEEKLDTGDFELRHKVDDDEPFILANFERKTWSDLAASIRDGRHETQWKRISDLKHANIRAYFMIEGALVPVEGQHHGLRNVCMWGLLDNMAARGLIAVHTRDEGHTIERIINICMHISEQKGALFNTITEVFLAKLEDMPEELAGDIKTDVSALVAKYKTVRHVDQEKIDPLTTAHGLCKAMWTKLGGDQFATSVMKNHSLRDFYNDPDIIKGTTFVLSGRKVPANKIKKMIDLARSGSFVSTIMPIIKGTGTAAAYIVEQLGEREVMNLTKTVELKRDGRRVNAKILPLFIEAVTYKLGS